MKYKGKKDYLNYIGKILDVKPRGKPLKVQFVKKQPGSNYFKFTDIKADIDPAVPYNALLKNYRNLQKTTDSNSSSKMSPVKL